MTFLQNLLSPIWVRTSCRVGWCFPVVPGECTQPCLGRTCQAVGTGIEDNVILDLLKSKKAFDCSSQRYGCHGLWYQLKHEMRDPKCHFLIVLLQTKSKSHLTLSSAPGMQTFEIQVPYAIALQIKNNWKRFTQVLKSVPHMKEKQVASSIPSTVYTVLQQGVTRGYKDGLQPETLADGNWLVKQSQPVSKIETKSDTNLRSLYES